jgi:hypothetical protein
MGAARSRRILAGILLIPIAIAASVEAGSRLYDRLRGEPWSAERGRASIENYCRILSEPFSVSDPQAAAEPSASGVGEESFPQPYIGWEDASTQMRIVADAGAYALPASRQTYDICIVGGRVAKDFASLGRERLLARLEENPRLQGRGIRVHDYAFAGFKQPQQAMVVSYLMAMGHLPDAVINLDGFDEAAFGWHNAKMGTHPLLPHLPDWTRAALPVRPDWETVERIHEIREIQDHALELGEWMLRSGLWRSCFLEHACSLRLRVLRDRYLSSRSAVVEHLRVRPAAIEIRGPSFAPDDESVAGAIVTAWEESSRSIRGMCRTRGIEYLHVLQPARFEAGGSEGAREIYPRLREAGRRLAARQVSFIDASDLFRGQPADLDPETSRLSGRGHEVLADAIAQAFLSANPR